MLNVHLRYKQIKLSWSVMLQFPSRWHHIASDLTFFCLFHSPDEGGERLVTGGGEGLGGEVVQRRSLPAGDRTAALPVGGRQRPAGAAAQHLRHTELQPDRRQHGERRHVCFLLLFVDPRRQTGRRLVDETFNRLVPSDPSVFLFQVSFCYFISRSCV